MQLMDHLLVNPPQFIIYLLVAFLLHMRGALLSLQNVKQLEYFTSRVHPVDVRALIATAGKIDLLARLDFFLTCSVIVEIPRYKASCCLHTRWHVVDLGTRFVCFVPSAETLHAGS